VAQLHDIYDDDDDDDDTPGSVNINVTLRRVYVTAVSVGKQ
jgi:hypothetical protein